jgi:uncharacterized protein (DUF433 family)
MRKQEAALFTPAEAAVLSRLSLKAVNNAIDKKTVTARRTRAGRLLDEPAIVYLSLERRLGGDTTPEFRRRLFAEIAAAPKRRFVSVGALKVDVGESRREVVERVKQLRRAERLVVSNPEILGGTPVFRATRIPVHRIAFLLRHGDTPEALRRSYPRLTSEMLAVAPIYAEAHPARGRPRKQPWHDRPPRQEWTVPLGDPPAS